VIVYLYKTEDFLLECLWRIILGSYHLHYIIEEVFVGQLYVKPTSTVLHTSLQTLQIERKFQSVSHSGLNEMNVYDPSKRYEMIQDLNEDAYRKCSLISPGGRSFQQERYINKQALYFTLTLPMSHFYLSDSMFWVPWTQKQKQIALQLIHYINIMLQMTIYSKFSHPKVQV